MKLYDKAAARLSQVTDAELKRLQQVYDRFQKNALEAKQELELRTRDYLESGVAYNTMQLQSAFLMIQNREAKQYFKDLSKELNRPFIYAEDMKEYGYFRGKHQYIDYTMLNIPATNRLKNVAAGLNLVANHRAALGEGEVVALHSERVWRFAFEGDGVQVLKDFIETCRTNPVIRITLGVRAVTLGGNNEQEP